MKKDDNKNKIQMKYREKLQQKAEYQMAAIEVILGAGIMVGFVFLYLMLKLFNP
ncbi:hypothetical protein [Peribacillus kribbensis]|uniref:hypothetical protein n=1 Tax=Peribacillus kribbensis TaxID=356658 RepID=UPI00040C15AE|nr:hypothetical protein [Peribacillus kribbensis]